MLRRECLAWLGASLCLGVMADPPVSLGTQPMPGGPQSPLRLPDVKFVSTPPTVVAAMLRMADLQYGDVLYDLGSGDGRIPIMAARTYGIAAVGIDIDERRIAEANAQAQPTLAGLTRDARIGEA